MEDKAILQNIPKALWNSLTPSTNEELLKDVPMGKSISPKEQPYKIYPPLPDEWYDTKTDAMQQIQAEDECNDTYGRIRMY